MKVNNKTGAPHILYGLKVNFNRYGKITEQNIDQLSRQFLSEHAVFLKIQPEALEFDKAVNNKGRWYVNFYQFYKGIPVYYANVGFTIHENGNVILAGSNAYPNIQIDVSPSFFSDDALNIAKTNFKQLTGTDSVSVIKEPELIIFPIETNTTYDFFLSYNIELELKDSTLIYSQEYFIDAKTGNIVCEYSNVVNGNISGTVQIQNWPDHYYDPINANYYKSGRIVLTILASGQTSTRYTNPSGYYNFSNLAYGYYRISARLEGSYLLLHQNNDSHVYYMTPGTHNWTWSATDATNVYYHANWIHDFYKTSPFNYGAMDYQMDAYVNEGAGANGWANRNDIGFGSEGGQYWARSSDVVYHEYTHNTIAHLYSQGGNPRFIGDYYGMDYHSEGRAMDEGLSDFFACTINNDHIQGESVGVNRDLDNNYTMDDYDQIPPVYGAHTNGLIISGACWDLRQDLGTNYVNELVFDALQMTPHAYTFEDFAVNIAVADDNDGNLNNSVPHYYSIKQAFETNHGITFNVPEPPPLSVTISGPTYLNQGQTGEFTANPNGGSTLYTNYKWWERKDEGGWVPESADEGGTILAPPPGEWIYVSSWEGQQTVQVARTYDFSLKCEVTDSDNNTATDIHSVIVGGGLAKTQGTVDETSGLAIPEGVELTGNFPNPFNPSTSIRFGLPEDVHLQLTIYSITGQKVISLADGYYSPGYYDIKWNGRNASGNLVSNGIYVYELRTGNQRLIKKMVFAK